MDNKNYSDLTSDEVKERSKLTCSEKIAVADFIKAAKQLPRSICIDLLDFDGELAVRKRVTRGAAVTVARLKKKSLIF